MEEIKQLRSVLLELQSDRKFLYYQAKDEKLRAMQLDKRVAELETEVGQLRAELEKAERQRDEANLDKVKEECLTGRRY